VSPEAASGLQRGASQMVGACLQVPSPDGDDSSVDSMRALVQSLQTDVESLQTRVSSVELEMRSLNFTHSDDLGNSHSQVVETSVDDDHPRLLMQTPVQEATGHHHEQMVGQCTILTPPNASKTSIEKRVEQLEASHDQRIKQNARCIRRLEFMVCMQRMDSLPANEPRAKSL